MNPDPTESIAPTLCRPAHSRRALGPDDCGDLIISIREHGQIQPAIVRLTPPGDTHPFEIVAGHRRHAAITYMHAAAAVFGEEPPTIGVEIRDLTDEAAFALADQDNRHRHDIPDYQRALEYTEALANHYAGHQLTMAKRLAIAPGTLSRYLSLATLPEIIVKSFGDPNKITIGHLAKLTPYLNNPTQRACLTAEAANLAAESAANPIPPACVLHRLTNAADPPAPRPPTHALYDSGGQILATGRLRTNKPGIHFTSASHAKADITEELSKILDFLFDTASCCTVQQYRVA